MSEYFKKVIYLKLYHGSSEGWDLSETERIGNAGFAKIELRDGRLSVEVQVRVVQAVISSGFKEIRMEKSDGSYSLLGMAEYSGGSLRFRAGGGHFERSELWGIRIPLSDAYQITGYLENKPAQPVPDSQPALSAQTEQEIPSDLPEIQAAELQEQVQDKPQQITEVEQAELPSPRELPRELMPQQSKWQHLNERFEQVHPFQDSRLYLNFKPEDFYILCEDDFLLRNNSFLLHGYHNYKHLILGIMPDSTGKEEYYIGVPGLFYEKEKDMAILFGFEGFESRTSRPTEGTFGYYMKRVRL